MESNVSLCGSEVTRKIKQLEVDGGGVARAPVPHSWRRQCLNVNDCAKANLSPIHTILSECSTPCLQLS